MRERGSACRGQADVLDWPYLKYGQCVGEGEGVVLVFLLIPRWQHSMKHPPPGGKDKMGERQREWQRWIWSDKAEGTKCCLFKFIILEIFLKCPVLVAHAHCSGRQCGPGVTAGVIKLNRTEILRITRISFTFSLILHMDYFTLMWLHRQRSRTAKCNSSSILIYTEHAAVHQQHPYSFL